MSRLKLFFLRGLGFICAAGFVIVIEFLLILVFNLIFNARLIPIGIGWLVLPFLFGIHGSKVAPYYYIIKLPKIINFLQIKFLALKKALIITLLWIFFICAFVIVFQPFGGSINDEELSFLIKAILFPPLIFGFIYYIYPRFIASDPQ